METEKKICPLSMSGDYDCPLISCQEEKCGWWDEDAQACAAVVLAKVVKKRK